MYWSVTVQVIGLCEKLLAGLTWTSVKGPYWPPYVHLRSSCRLPAIESR